MEFNYILLIIILILVFIIMKKPIISFFSNKKIPLWIYNPILVNSNKWKTSYSRRSVQDTTGLVKLCIRSARFNLGEKYDIKIFNQDDLDTLIPECLPVLRKCKTTKVVEEYIKYSILYKYGGIWLPNSTIVLNPLRLNMGEYNSGKLLLFGINHEDYQEAPTYSDLIVASTVNTQIVRNILDILDESLKGFNYDNNFNNYINNYINSRPGDLYVSLLVLQYDMEEESIEKRDIVTSFNNRLIEYDDYVFYYIPISEFQRYTAYTFMLRMSPNDILTSNTFIGELFKYSVKRNELLVYSAILNK